MSAFSVLMSVYYKERAEFLCQSLDSVFAQTLPPSEVVLVEDGPLTPDLDAAIERYQSEHQELKVVKLPVNGGLGNALNEGLKHCTHDIVARMDSDDIAFPQRFELQVCFMDAHPDVDIVSSWIAEFKDNLQNIQSIRKVPETHQKIYRFAKKRCPVNHPSVVFRKRDVEDSGGYQHFPLFEDYYLWVRMLQNGAKFYNLQEPLLYFRLSTDMFQRRGGIRYAIDEIHLQIQFLKMRFIDPIEFICNVSTRFIIRILPNRLRERFYHLVIR